MQPLTPAERREIERAKDAIKQSGVKGLSIEDAFDSIYFSSNKELWLKVLTMALSQNEAVMAEWRKTK